jgi:hypothetical protein
MRLDAPIVGRDSQTGAVLYRTPNLIRVRTFGLSTCHGRSKRANG